MLTELLVFYKQLIKWEGIQTLWDGVERHNTQNDYKT